MVIKIKSTRQGEHVHQRVFVGPDRERLALAGWLTMNVGEWQTFGAALLLGEARMAGVRRSQGVPFRDLEVILVGGEAVVRAEAEALS